MSHRPLKYLCSNLKCWNNYWSTCSVSGDNYAIRVTATDETVCRCSHNTYYLLDQLRQFNVDDVISHCKCTLLDHFQYCQCTEQFTYNANNSTCVPVSYLFFWFSFDFTFWIDFLEFSFNNHLYIVILYSIKSLLFRFFYFNIKDSAWLIK